jgi:hypothetical protein
MSCKRYKKYVERYIEWVEGRGGEWGERWVLQVIGYGNRLDPHGHPSDISHPTSMTFENEGGREWGREGEGKGERGGEEGEGKGERGRKEGRERASTWEEMGASKGNSPSRGQEV